jgi:hypothetical protein
LIVQINPTFLGSGKRKLCIQSSNQNTVRPAVPVPIFAAIPRIEKAVVWWFSIDAEPRTHSIKIIIGRSSFIMSLITI